MGLSRPKWEDSPRVYFLLLRRRRGDSGSYCRRPMCLTRAPNDAQGRACCAGDQQAWALVSACGPWPVRGQARPRAAGLLARPVRSSNLLHGCCDSNLGPSNDTPPRLTLPSTWPRSVTCSFKFEYKFPR